MRLARCGVLGSGRDARAPIGLETEMEPQMDVNFEADTQQFIKVCGPPARCHFGWVIRRALGGILTHGPGDLDEIPDRISLFVWRCDICDGSAGAVGLGSGRHDNWECGERERFRDSNGR